jgi:hypothetical protein
MDLNAFLNPSDAARAQRALCKLAAHNHSSLSLAGGFAIELHMLQHGSETILRPLHDIDFIAASFHDIPTGFGQELLLRHVHPHDPPGKTLLQGIDPDSELRIDLFRAYGDEMERSVPINLAGLSLRMVSLEDMFARHARLNWDLIEGHSIAPKFARDFLRMAALVSTTETQPIWQEHRKPQSPLDFSETLVRLREAIQSHQRLLVSPTYSTDITQVCGRCESTPGFPLADAAQILSILGYC